MFKPGDFVRKYNDPFWRIYEVIDVNVNAMHPHLLKIRRLGDNKEFIYNNEKDTLISNSEPVKPAIILNFREYYLENV